MSRGKPTHASDVFAWGVLLYKLLTGLDVRGPHWQGGLYEFDLYCPRVLPTGVRVLLAGCLVTNPELRLTAAQALQQVMRVWD